MASLEKIVERLERTEGKVKDLVKLAQDLARTAMVLINSRHHPLQETDNLKHIERQLLQTTVLEEQDAKYVKKIITDLVRANPKKEWLEQKINEVIFDFQTQEVLLRDIEFIVQDRKENKFDQLSKLIANLLEEVQKAHDELDAIDTELRKVA